MANFLLTNPTNPRPYVVVVLGHPDEEVYASRCNYSLGLANGLALANATATVFLLAKRIASWTSQKWEQSVEKSCQNNVVWMGPCWTAPDNMEIELITSHQCLQDNVGDVGCYLTIVTSDSHAARANAIWTAAFHSAPIHTFMEDFNGQLLDDDQQLIVPLLRPDQWVSSCPTTHKEVLSKHRFNKEQEHHATFLQQLQTSGDGDFACYLRKKILRSRLTSQEDKQVLMDALIDFCPTLLEVPIVSNDVPTDRLVNFYLLRKNQPIVNRGTFRRKRSNILRFKISQDNTESHGWRLHLAKTTMFFRAYLMEHSILTGTTRFDMKTITTVRFNVFDAKLWKYGKSCHRYKISREKDTENDTAKVREKEKEKAIKIKAKAKAKENNNKDIDNPNVWTLQDYFYAFDEPVEGTVCYIISFSKSIKGVESPHRFRIDEESRTVVENENDSGLEWNRCDSFFAFPGRGRIDQVEQTSDDDVLVGETKN
jgi:hypothetical protein